MHEKYNLSKDMPLNKQVYSEGSVFETKLKIAVNDQLKQ